MRPLLLSAALAALLAAAGAAQAAPVSKPKPLPSVDNVYWMVDCMIAAGNRELEKALSTVPAPGGLERHWFKAALGECLKEDRPIPAAYFYKRGALAERFLYRDFSSIGAASRRRPAPVFPPVGADYLAKEPKAVSALAMLDAASCLVRSNPQQAYNFFRLKRDSAEERAKVSEMAPALSKCLTKGEPIKLTAAIFRAFLAEAAYRVAAGQPEVFEGQT
ncbi:MAG TPA: hypothetical protein VFP12_11510 [Allosphingosinicella sp.]|nr:hypothetical protein [Allosphingosinicella sp.]